jgi:hypothetical protein
LPVTLPSIDATGSTGQRHLSASRYPRVVAATAQRLQFLRRFAAFVVGRGRAARGRGLPSADHANTIAVIVTRITQRNPQVSASQR